VRIRSRDDCTGKESQSAAALGTGRSGAAPRLFLAILLGLGVLALLPAEWRLATRSLVLSDIALGFYLVLAFRLMTNCDVNRIKRRAAHQDEGFVVGMSPQVSDVAVSSSMLRRLVAAHGAVSFIFNATLLALTVNIAPARDDFSLRITPPCHSPR
jgi:uncharacterized membrane protein